VYDHRNDQHEHRAAVERRPREVEMEQMAIIRQPRLGCSDRGMVALSFETYINESSAALQVLWVETNDEDRAKAFDLLRAVDDVSKLDGKPCLVEVSSGMIRYLRQMKI
jgi:hypothetical protein